MRRGHTDDSDAATSPAAAATAADEQFDEFLWDIDLTARRPRATPPAHLRPAQPGSQPGSRPVPRPAAQVPMLPPPERLPSRQPEPTRRPEPSASDPTPPHATSPTPSHARIPTPPPAPHPAPPPVSDPAPLPASDPHAHTHPRYRSAQPSAPAAAPRHGRGRFYRPELEPGWRRLTANPYLQLTAGTLLASATAYLVVVALTR